MFTAICCSLSLLIYFQSFIATPTVNATSQNTPRLLPHSSLRVCGTLLFMVFSVRLSDPNVCLSSDLISVWLLDLMLLLPFKLVFDLKLCLVFVRPSLTFYFFLNLVCDFTLTHSIFIFCGHPSDLVVLLAFYLDLNVCWYYVLYNFGLADLFSFLYHNCLIFTDSLSPKMVILGLLQLIMKSWTI